jgi:hypothetical protein
MILKRNDIVEKFPWLKDRDCRFITSADYDGLICAAFLHHYLNWELVGFYDLESIWVTEKGMHHREDLIWVDLNILPRQGRAIGGHIVSPEGELPSGFETSCNPNILTDVTASEFHRKFPFSTVIFLMWLHNTPVPVKDRARMWVLHSDSAWLKYQNFKANAQSWVKICAEYPWQKLFRLVTSVKFEKYVDEMFYPHLAELGGVSSRGKLKSLNRKIPARQFQFNPDWDEDVVYRLFSEFGNDLKWTPPEYPSPLKRIEGIRHRIPLREVKKQGLNTFLRTKKVFSYAIPSPGIFNYTTFGHVKKSPMDAPK